MGVRAAGSGRCGPVAQILLSVLDPGSYTKHAGVWRMRANPKPCCKGPMKRQIRHKSDSKVRQLLSFTGGLIKRLKSRKARQVNWLPKN